MSFLDSIAYWKTKQPYHNLWHPIPGESPVDKDLKPYVPSWILALDFEAMAVDVAPFICGAGALAHLRQLPQMGFTVPASVFRNQRTLDAMYKTGFIGMGLVALFAMTGVEYRYAIPRYAHERERRRDEELVRKLVLPGEFLGIGLYAARIYRSGGFTKIAKSRIVPLEVIFGVALSDLAHREYCKAHGL